MHGVRAYSMLVPMQHKKVLIVLFMTLLLDTVGIGMLVPIIPSLFTDPSSPSFLLAGYSVSSQYLLAGILTALFGLMQFFASPVLGELSDMYGRKKILTIGVAVLALSQLLFASGIALASLTLLFISRAIAGIAGANFSVAQAMIADITTPENRARNFGLIGAAFGLGFMVGPLLGGVLVGVTGNPSIPFILAGILGIINVLLVTLFLPETHHVRSEKKAVTVLRALHHIQSAYQDRELRPVYTASFMSVLGFTFYTTFIPILLSVRFDFSEAMTGTYFGMVGVWIIVSQVLVVRILSKHYSDYTRLLYSLPIVAVCILLQSLVPEAYYLYMIMPLFSAAFALVNTSIPALVSKNVGSERQGAALGINASLGALSMTIAPFLAGLASGNLGISSAFIIGSVCVFFAFYIVRFRISPKAHA